MENNSIIKGTLNLDDLPFLKDYEELKPRLSMRLNDFRRIAPDVLTQPFLNFSVTFHIDVSNVVGREGASCIMKKEMLDFLKVGKARIFHDAIENSLETRPAVTMPIEKYMGGMGFPEMEEKSGLNVDVVFWTRADSEGVVNEGLTTMSEEELEAHKQEKIANLTEEETAIMSALHDSLPGEVFKFRDMPEGTITTSPYYTDLNVLVTLK